MNSLCTYYLGLGWDLNASLESWDHDHLENSQETFALMWTTCLFRAHFYVVGPALPMKQSFVLCIPMCLIYYVTIRSDPVHFKSFDFSKLFCTFNSRHHHSCQFEDTFKFKLRSMYKVGSKPSSSPLCPASPGPDNAGND